MRSYLAERNFLFLYFYKMFYRSASALIHVFTGTYMVSSGMSVSTVILFYVVTIASIILTSPLGVGSILKYGLKVSAFFSIFCRTAFFLMFLLVDNGYEYLLWPAALIYGVAYGIFPFRDIIEAVYIKENHHRGKQLTMSMVLSSVAVAIALALAGVLIPTYGFAAVVVLSLFLQLCSVWALLQMEGEPLHVENYKIRDGFSFAASMPMKKVHKVIWSQELVQSTFVVIVPLYIFHVIGDMVTFAYLAAGATILEVVITLLFGQFLDKCKSGATHRKSSLMVIVSSLGFIFFTKTALGILIVDSLNRISMSSHIATCSTSIHKELKARKDTKSLLLYSSTWQMTYGVLEISSLLVLACVYHFFGDVVFTVAFCFAIFGALLNYFYFSKKNMEKESSEDGA